jgi:hypothetical protein
MTEKKRYNNAFTTKRISVPFSEEIYEQIEKESKLIGVSKSAYIAFIVGQQYAVKQQMMNGVQMTMNDLLIESNKKK